MRGGLTQEQKELYISRISDDLSMLRAKAGLTQERLANYTGISRQTYYAIETKQKRMSWGTFLALLFVYDSIPETSAVLKKLDIYPTEFLGLLRGEQLTEGEAEPAPAR